MSDAIYHPDGPSRFAPTELARGPWDPNAQHGGAPAALLAGTLEQVDSDAPMAIKRITYEFLRPIPLAPIEVRTRLTRPGRRVQLLEATLHAGDDEVARAVALRIRSDAIAAPDPLGEKPPPRDPGASDPIHMPAFERGPSGFARDAMEIRFAAGTFTAVGPAFAWFRLRVPVIAGEPLTPLQRLAAAGDFGNGIASAVSWSTHVFINPDLTIYVEREPAGEWVGLDAVTRVGTQGAGISDSVLHDERGRVGRSMQSLYVAER